MSSLTWKRQPELFKFDFQGGIARIYGLYAAMKTWKLLLKIDFKTVDTILFETNFTTFIDFEPFSDVIKCSSNMQHVVSNPWFLLNT